MTSMHRRSSEFSCAHCDACPRHPCYSAEEVMECPNAHQSTREYARSRLPGYDQDAADELDEYRRRFGPLKR